jgi:hypothetical protein
MLSNGFELSPADQALIDAQLWVNHPSELGEMVDRIEPGTAIVDVEAMYHVQASDDERDAWVRCGACGKSHNHKRGFVVLLPEGKRGTIGHDCGEKKHALEYRQQLAQFEARLVRQRTLRRILRADELRGSLVAQVNGLQRNGGVRTLGELRHDFGKRFPKLCGELLGAPTGQLLSKVKLRDAEAERARRTRLDRKLTDLAKLREVSRDKAGVDERLLAELVASNDRDTSKAPIWRYEMRPLDSYYGVPFITKMGRLDDRLASLRRRANHCLDEFAGRQSASFDDKQLHEGLQDFVRIVREALRLHQEIRDALLFLDPANISRIITFTSRTPKRREVVGTYAYEDGVFRHLGRGTALDLRIPIPSLSDAPLIEMYFGVTGERVALRAAAE